MSGFDNEVLIADNVDFRGVKPYSAQMTTDGQMLIGSSVSPKIRVGTISNGTNISWTFGNGTASAGLSGQIAVSNGGTGVATLPAYSVVLGNGTFPVNTVGPSATAGQIFQSQGAAAFPAFSTATYPATTTISQILYSSSANVVAGLATANSAALVTSSAGVPVMSSTMTNGQLIIGSTGATPAAGTPTSTGGNYIVGAGTLKYIPANYMPNCSNIGIAYSAGTFTVQGADGTALSATNPGYVVLQSKANPGRYLTYTITANQTFVDSAGASTIAGNLFNFVSGTATTVDIPFFLYACSADDGTTITFGCSRVPHRRTAPATTLIGCPGTATADAAAAIFLFSTVTIANYDLNPVLCIGSFRMRFTATAGGDWTVQALNTNDGVGNFQEDVLFTQPLGQFSANSGTICIPNGGTAAVFTSTAAEYFINRTGICSYSALLSGDGGTDGSGAVAAFWSAPFIQGTTNTNYKGSCYYKIGAGAYAVATMVIASPAGTTPAFELIDGSSGTAITWAAFTNANRIVSVSCTYPIDLLS